MSKNITMLTKYQDGTYRMISEEELSIGDTVQFQNSQWVTETGQVADVIEKHPSRGQWQKSPPQFLTILN